MPEHLLESLRASLREIERFEKANAVPPQLAEVKKSLSEMIATLEARVKREGHS